MSRIESTKSRLAQIESASDKQIEKMEESKTGCKVSTPVPKSYKYNDNKPMLLDFTGYLAMSSGGDDEIMPDHRSRSYTPTKLFTRSSRVKCTPEELKCKIDEKQKKAEEIRNRIQKQSFLKAREIDLPLTKENEAARKLDRLNQKLEQAELRKAQHLDSIKDKAKQESDKLEENAFILSLILQGK